MDTNNPNISPHAYLAEKDYIPFFGGRPERDKPINKHDIADLKIDLWSIHDIKDFISLI